MEFETTERSSEDVGAPIEDVAQEAIDATALAYTRDAGIDVEEHLRAQFSSRGVTTSEETVTEVAREIRAGHEIRVGRPDGSTELRQE